MTPEESTAMMVDYARSEEVPETLRGGEAENARLRAALTRLRDCDWVITLPDRMDAVRDIARDALDAGKGEKA